VPDEHPGLVDTPEALPAVGGAYLLLLDLAAPLALPPRFAGRVLEAGRYGYAGSAYGPGGIRGRCRRHLGRPAARRWHVDWLTGSADDLRVVGFPGGSECALIDRLARHGGVTFPVPGFGSTDCRRCPAHLVRFDLTGPWEALLTALDASP